MFWLYLNALVLTDWYFHKTPHSLITHKHEVAVLYWVITNQYEWGMCKQLSRKTNLMSENMDDYCLQSPIRCHWNALSFCSIFKIDYFIFQRYQESKLISSDTRTSLYCCNSRKQFPLESECERICLCFVHVYSGCVQRKKKLRKIEEWLEVWYDDLFSQSNVFIANWKVI